MNKEPESWITNVYQEFWSKAQELASKEIGSNSATDARVSEHRESHINTMVAMFIATMQAPISKDEDEEPECDDCDKLPECQERWEREGWKQN
jgi:hypothetical protein